MAKKFPSDLASRGTVKITDKLLIHNIDSGASCYCTVTELLAALSIYGNVGIGVTTGLLKLHIFKTSELPAASGSTPAGMLMLGGSNNALNMGMNPSSPFGAWLQAQDVSDLSIEYPLCLNPNGGNVGIGTNDPKSALHVVGIAEYADNTAAVAAGLTAGAFYRTGDALKIVHA